jgi:hypothetical protein
MHDRAAEPIGATTSATTVATEIIILLSIEVRIPRVRLRVEEKRSALPSTNKRRPSPNFSGEGLVDFSLSSYFLQHLLEQHFPLLLQQSAAGDAAVAVPINAAKVATKRRYFISPPLEFRWNSAAIFTRAEPTLRRTRRAAVEPTDAQCAPLHARRQG